MIYHIRSLCCKRYTFLLLLSLLFVSASTSIGQNCTFDVLQPLSLPVIPEEIISSDIVNASFESVGPNYFYGRSLILGINSFPAPQIAIVTLDQRDDYPPQLIPEFQMRTLNIPGLSGMTVVERVLGAQDETGLHPDLLNFIGAPLLLLTDGTGNLSVRTLGDSLVLGPWTPAELGLPMGFIPSALTFNNDMLWLFIFGGDPLAMYVFDFPFFEDGIPPLPLFGPVDVSPFIEYGEILDADFVEGVNQLHLLLDAPCQVVTLDVNNPASPLYISATPIFEDMLAASVSQGWCNLFEGFGQVVGVITNSLGDLECVATPCTPGFPICPLQQMTPVMGTYLEPRVGMSLACDPRVSNYGTLELYGTVDGPWWPTMLHGLAGPNPGAMFEFALDTSGASTLELSDRPSWMHGDGWRVLYEPLNPIEEETYLSLCFDFFPHGATLCAETSIDIQSNFEPVFLCPAINGWIIRTDTVTEDTIDIENPEPEVVERTVVERDIAENEVAEDINPIGQHRSGLPRHIIVRRDSLGNPIDTTYGEEGGVHCAPTAAIQNLLAMARRNPCLCRLINCYVGKDPNDDCSSFTPEQLTELILTMGIAAKLSPETGSEYTDAVTGLEEFLRILVAEVGSCAGNCDHNIYGHFIPCGSDGESPNWGDIYEEMHTNKQTIMLRLLEVGPDGKKYEHRVSLTDILAEKDGKVLIWIADPWTGNYKKLKINTTTAPPTILSISPRPPNWQKITGAIAMSDSTPRGSRSLDEEYLDWELVLDQPGPITSFVLENLTPGPWLYRVKVYTFDGDSAMAYRLFYVMAPDELTVIRVGDELHLNWHGDPDAVDYIIMYADNLDDDFQPLATTPDTFFVTSYDEADLRFYKVITNFDEP